MKTTGSAEEEDDDGCGAAARTTASTATSPVEECLAEGEVFAFDSVSLDEQNQPQAPGSSSSSSHKEDDTSAWKDHASKGLIYMPAYKVRLNCILCQDHSYLSSCESL